MKTNGRIWGCVRKMVSKGAWSMVAVAALANVAQAQNERAATARPSNMVASPGAIAAGLPRSANERAPSGPQRMPENRGSVGARLTEAALGINPGPYFNSMMENAKLPQGVRLTTNAQLRNLPGIETRSNPNAAPNETVCGNDGRTRITSTTSTPWRWNCKLVITMPDGQKYSGTGWLVGPRCVMTAGHVVHDGGRGQKWATRIEVIPAMNGSSRPYGTFVSTRFYSVNGWINDGNADFDYGCIILPSNVGDSLGYFGFANYNTTTLRGVTMNTAGYPADKTYGTMWFMSGAMHQVYSRELQYYTDTYGGQSGSCVWRLTNGSRYAVGIHVRGGCPNEATRITSDVYNNIVNWRRL